METFTWCPLNQPTGDVTLRTRVAQFGDGYSQAAGDGINTKEQEWPLSFTQGEAEAQEIVDFFDRHQGYKAFFWQPPLGGVGLYRVTNYSIRPLRPGLYHIAATFVQTFHP